MQDSLLSSWLSGSKDPKGVPVLVQGITGRYGRLHTELMLNYGTNIVAGVTPGKGGTEVLGVPVFDSCDEAVRRTGAATSVVFVPAPNYLSAVVEAIRAGIKLVVGITERVPVRDTLRSLEEARRYNANLIGPNTPGIIFPGRIKLGIMPVQPFIAGDTLVLSRSGTLTYEISNYLRKAGIGIYSAIGIGGDPINSTNFIEALEMARDNSSINNIVIIGEIGGDAEERVASYISSTGLRKKVVAYIAGRSAPKEKKMGHAGAIIMGEAGTVESKERALNSAGVPVAKMPWEVPELVRHKN
ncbi:MAG: succinate--CoA ligase subunit alpha [Conexivisphaerales archaeon]